ncbi:MAG: hypothetical protein RLO51_07055 [Thalassobaculum sp.]|uniref:hypothetical protein n=1 Tax=Thalassobaculum sp. TaxID=2022740 RepID=UPI0032EE8831
MRAITALMRTGAALLIVSALGGCLATTTAPPAAPEDRAALGARAGSLLALSAGSPLVDRTDGKLRAQAGYAEQAFDLYDRTGDHKGRWQAAQNAARAYQDLHEYEKALLFFGEAADSGGKADCLPCVATAEQGLGAVAALLGRPDMRAHFVRAASLHELSGDGRAAASNWYLLGQLQSARGDLDDAILAFDRSEALYRAYEDPELAARSIIGKAGVAIRRGDPDTAGSETRRALEIQRGLKFRIDEVISLTILARLAHDRGDGAAALARLQEAESAQEREATANFHGNEFYAIASTYRQLGLADQALATLAKSRDAFRRSGISLGEATALLGLAEIAHTAKDFDSARREVDAAEQVLTRGSNKEGLAVALRIVPIERWKCTARILVLRGSLAIQGKDLELAASRFDTAMALYRRNGAEVEGARAQMLKGLSLLGTPRRAEGLRLLTEARQVLAKHGVQTKFDNKDEMFLKLLELSGAESA